MALVDLKRDPSAREVRQFARLWLPGFCTLFAVWAALRWQSWGAAAAFLGVAASGALLDWSRPGWMKALYVAWMWAAFPIGWTVSHLLMATIYYLVITPIGLMMRLLGRDPLERRFDRGAETYWTRRDPAPHASQYFRQF